jgi:ribonuclease-3
MKEKLESLGIIPNNLKLYDIAFSHSSYANEHKNKTDYERLEFLGDAVLELVMSDYLYRNFEEEEGEMTKWRANFVCENALFEYMTNMDIIQFIKVGHGELGEIKKAIVADTFEALMGAIYLDKGFDEVKSVIIKIIAPYVVNSNKTGFLNDYKSILQEAVQTDRRSLVYDLVDESGPPHDKEFTVEVRIDGVIYGRGVGKSKKDACQNAACDALKKLARVENENE